jgi:hypothetical protein
MSDGGGREIKVDIDAMEELSRQLHRIQGNLADPSHDIEAFGCEYGSEKIETALENFIKGWKDGRAEIRNGLDEIVGDLDGTIQTYEEQEQRIAAATQGQAKP